MAMLKNNQKNIPRWEWRIFGDEFIEAERFIRQFPVQKIRKSSEIYIISSKSQHNCKIRDGLLDLKVLEQKNPSYLELWRPVLKSDFPLTEEVLKVFIKFLSIESIIFNTFDPIPLEAFLNNIRSCPELRVVEIVKERYGYEIDGLTVEIANVDVQGRNLRTIGVEHENEEKVATFVESLGFKLENNMNYIAALKTLVGWR